MVRPLCRDAFPPPLPTPLSRDSFSKEDEEEEYSVRVSFCFWPYGLGEDPVLFPFLFFPLFFRARVFGKKGQRTNESHSTLRKASQRWRKHLRKGNPPDLCCFLRLLPIPLLKREGRSDTTSVLSFPTPPPFFFVLSSLGTKRARGLCTASVFGPLSETPC